VCNHPWLIVGRSVESPLVFVASLDPVVSAPLPMAAVPPVELVLPHTRRSAVSLVLPRLLHHDGTPGPGAPPFVCTHDSRCGQG
jgi:hypothetical protein